jgi:hypothetical protein
LPSLLNALRYTCPLKDFLNFGFIFIIFITNNSRQLIRFITIFTPNLLDATEPFFENRVTEYAKSATTGSWEDAFIIFKDK